MVRWNKYFVLWMLEKDYEFYVKGNMLLILME